MGASLLRFGLIVWVDPPDGREVAANPSSPQGYDVGEGEVGEGDRVDDGEGCEWRRSCRSTGPWKRAATTRSTNSDRMMISVNRRTSAG
jgi:hypothetical protein